MVAKDIMTKTVVTFNRDTTVKEIAQILTNKNISGAPVVDENGDIVGIVTKKDLIYKDLELKFPSYVEFLGGVFLVEGAKHFEEKLKKLLGNTAEEIMTKDVISVGENTDVKEIAEIMIEKRINRVPVLSNGKMVGIISRSDIVKSLIL